MRTIACNAPYGKGGMGQHLAHLVEASRRAGMLARYYSPAPQEGGERGQRVERRRWRDWLLWYTPVRFRPAWRSFLDNELFDRRVARRLQRPLGRFMSFAGASLRSFQQAEARGAEPLELVSATSHVHNLKRRHDHAHERHGMDDSWLNGAQVRKTLREYAAADTIYVHSDYTRRTFREAGVPAEALERTYLQVHPRFRPPPHRPSDATFRAVYVGRIEATKGVPVLLEAFSRLPTADKTLTLVGGWSTRRMRVYMQDWLSDPRIRMAPGDPLPALHDADVFVHPTYEDGFGYAPMEALACGTPVVVTTDTGMKEYVREEENGYVVPTGRVAPLVDRLERLRRHPRATTQSLLPPAYHEEQDASFADMLAKGGLPSG